MRVSYDWLMALRIMRYCPYFTISGRVLQYGEQRQNAELNVQNRFLSKKTLSDSRWQGWADRSG